MNNNVFDQALISLAIASLSSCCTCPPPPRVPYVSGGTQALKLCVSAGDSLGEDMQRAALQPATQKEMFDFSEWYADYRDCVDDAGIISDMSDRGEDSYRIMQGD